MFGAGKITEDPKKRLLLILMVGVFWLALVLVLGIWWSSVISKQSTQIVQLESQLGVGLQAAQVHRSQTQRMLFWESITFCMLLALSTGLLFWLHWRDMRRSRSMQAFFASITHELRTPLTSIRLQAESIAESLPAQSPESALLSRLLEDTLRLESQVDRTLELVRVERGGVLFPQPLPLKNLVERVIQPFQETHKQRLLVKNQIQDSLVQADPAAVQVIVRNLLENSVRHSKKDSVQATFESKQSKDGVWIVYSDNGQGCKDQKDLGGLFAKGPASQGAGVGLYLVRTLMRRMGGQAVFAGTNGFEAHLFFKGSSEKEGRIDA